MQVIVARVQDSGRSLQFLYTRQKGLDTWFGFVGMGGSLNSVSEAKNISDDVREAADDAVLAAGYPIRTIGGDESDSGQLEQFFKATYHVYSFITHPDTFSVYRTADMQPNGTPGSGETHIEIVNEQGGTVTVDAESGGASPPTYAIEEAVLFRYHAKQGSQSLPSVQIQ